MARLRKPSPIEQAIFLPSASATTARTTRSSPRKNVNESPSTRKLRYTSSQDSDEDSFLVPKAPANQSPARKQRVLRPVASNASLAKRPSNESLRSLVATPDKDRRQRRPLREGGNAANYLYSKTLARSVARRNGPLNVRRGSEAENTPTLADDREMETSILCKDDAEAEGGDKENVAENSDWDTDEEPVINASVRRQQSRARPILFDSEEEDDDYEDAAESHDTQTLAIEPPQSPSKMMPPPPLTIMKPPHRKGHSTISNWAQDVIDLTGSPGPQASSVLPPPARARTASFAASSRASSRASNCNDDILV